MSYQFSVTPPAGGPTTVLPITAPRGGSWVPAAIQPNGTPYATSSCQGDMSSGYPGSKTFNALQLNGAPGQFGTTSTAVNTAETFSVSGWFCSTKAAAGGTTIQSLIAIADTGAPGGALRLDPNGWAELDTWTTGNAVEQVQIQPQTDNTWFFLSAVYDTANRQLRITVNSQAFTGQMFNPVMTQGVLTSKQFSDAQAAFTSTTQGVLK